MNDPIIAGTEQIYQHLIIINGFLKQIKRQNLEESRCIETLYQEFYRFVRHIINGDQKMINNHVVDILIKSEQSIQSERSIEKLIESRRESFPVSTSIIEIFLKCTNILSLLDEFNTLMRSLPFKGKLATFQAKLASFLLESTLPTEKELMKFLFDNITMYFSLDIFGSSVFDIDNANDLDIVDAETKNCFSRMTYMDLIDSLELYFNVETIIGISTYPDNRRRVTGVMLSYDLLGLIPGFKEKNFETRLKKMKLKINYVPRSLFKKSFNSSCDFWEMGLIKTHQGIYMRKDLCDHPNQPFPGPCPRPRPCPALCPGSGPANIPDLIKTSFLNKTLTPIKIREDLEHGVAPNPPCDTQCKLSHFYNRIKHIRRYIAKTHIYQINENMPFLQNCIFHNRDLLTKQISMHIDVLPTDLHKLIMSFCEVLIESTPYCELCNQLLTNDSVIDGKFIIKISFGSGYIHDKCFSATSYKINMKKIKMDKILTNFFCKRDTEIFL